jgi:hypothetical protein
MPERRPKNSDLALQKLEEAEAAARDEDHGILEIFERPEDEPLSRDDDPGQSGIRDAR